MARKRTTRREKGQGSYWYDKKNQRHVATDRDAERAKAKFETLKHQILGGIDTEGGKQVLQDWFAQYIATEVVQQYKQSTAYDYQKRADYYILPTLGGYRLCDLKRYIIIAWVNAMLETTDRKDRPWSLHSIRQALRLLQRSLQAAVNEGYLEDNPAASVKVPRRRKGDERIIDTDDLQDKALTPGQAQQVLDEVRRTEHAHGLTLLYELAIRFGLRRGELLGLRWKDIDIEQKLIRIRQQVIRLDKEIIATTPKTPRSRRDIPVTDDIVTMLRERHSLLEANGQLRELVFPAKDGGIRRPDGITQHIARVYKRLGLTGFTFHTLRKTAITDLRRHGADAETTAAIAGHGVNVMANVYSEAQMDRKRQTVEKKGKTE